MILLSDIGGGTDLVGVDYRLDDAAATKPYSSPTRQELTDQQILAQAITGQHRDH